ncbi:MAG: tetratricopeptide repeat protein [Planctomycetota bacterium]|jgi:tetratricopeptide (TPR) repeat protein
MKTARFAVTAVREKRGLARIPRFLREFVPVPRFFPERAGSVGLTVIAVLLAGLLAAPAPAAEKAVDIEMLYQEALHKEEGDGDLEGAINAYKRVLAEYDKTSPLAAKAQLRIAKALERMGKKDEAVAAYREVAAKFTGSAEAAAAEERLSALGVRRETPAPAEIAEDPMKKEIQRKIALRLPSFDFPNTTFDMIINILREIGELNIVVDARITVPDTTLSLQFNNVSLEDVLSYVARMTNLDWTIWKGAIFISTPNFVEEARREEDADALHAAEIALLDAGIATARALLEDARILVARGRMSQSDFMKVELALIEAEVAKKRFLAGAPSSGALETATPRVPAAGPAPDQLWRKVALYAADLDIPNFAGPSAVDLDSGMAVPLPRGVTARAFLEQNPQFDVLYPSATGDHFVLNKGRRVAELARYATLDTLPAEMDYAEPAPVNSVFELPRPAPAPKRSADEREDAVMERMKEADQKFEERLREQSERAREEYPPAAPFVHVDKEGFGALRLSYIRSTGSLVPMRFEWFVLRTDKAEYFVKRTGRGVKIELEYAMITAARPPVTAGSDKEQLPDIRALMPNAKEAVLYSLSLRNFSGPQFLDLDTGKTAPAGGLGSMREADPAFDLAFEGQAVPKAYGIGRTVRAVYVPADTTVASVPADLQYRKRTDCWIEYKPLPLVVQTDKGEYLVRAILQGNEFVRVYYEKVSDRGSGIEALKLGPAREITLADADLEGTGKPQIVDLETGETESDIAARYPEPEEFLRANPQYDLIYDRQLVLLSPGSRAALLAYAATPAYIGEVNFEDKGEPEKMSELSPGVYAFHQQGLSNLIIEPGGRPLLIETTEGTYFVEILNRSEDEIKLRYWKVR